MPSSQSSEAAHRRQTPRVPLRLKPAAFSEANSLAGAAAVEKKRRSRVEDLETKLGETMVELKLLKKQLELEEVAKRVVLKKLENTKKEKLQSTDICEMAEMRAKLAEKEKELETVMKEAEQATAEMGTKLAGTEEELRQSRAMLEQMKQRMESQEGEKDAMEAEMKRLRIQTDQWRKASEAAASILDCESFGSVRKPVEGRGGGGGMRVLGELWKKKRGQQK